MFFNVLKITNYVNFTNFFYDLSNLQFLISLFYRQSRILLTKSVTNTISYFAIISSYFSFLLFHVKSVSEDSENKVTNKITGATYYET